MVVVWNQIHNISKAGLYYELNFQVSVVIVKAYPLTFKRLYTKFITHSKLTAS